MRTKTEQKFLDNHGFTGIPEHAVQHLFQFVFRLLQVVYDKYALARRQSVGFKHVRGFQRFEKGISRFQIFLRETFISGRGYIVTHHESFGKLLAAFQAGAFLRRAYNRYVFQLLARYEVVVYSFYQWVFGAHNDHIDMFFHCKFPDGIEVGRRYRHVRTYGCGSGISRCDIEFVGFWTLLYLPS